MSADLFELLATEVGGLLHPLQRAAEIPGALGKILSILGAPPDSANPTLTATIVAIVDLKRQIETLVAEDSASFDDIRALLGTSERAFDAVRQIDAASGPLAQLPGISGDLVEWLVTGWLAESHPVVHRIAALLTLIELESEQDFTEAQLQGTQVIRYPYRIERLHLGRFVSLIRDPVTMLRAAYVTPLLTGADADAMADALFPKVVGLLRNLGISCRYGVNPGDETVLGDSAPYMNHALIVYLTDPLLQDVAFEAGVVLTFSSADRGDLGLVVRPFGGLKATRSTGPFIVELDLTAGIEVLAVGRHGFTLLAGSSTTEVAGSVSASLEPSDSPGFVLGSPTGTRLEVGGAQLKLETSLSKARQSLALSADVSSSTLVISPGDGDGFLSSILPADGMRADFDLGLAWSSERGLSLRGSAGLDATLPIGLSIGGVTLSTIHLSLQARDASVLAEVSASIAASIGPVHVVVDRVGIAAEVTFPETGGNIGVADLDLGFKPPTGAGLSIDEAVVTGGGFLAFDSERGQYAGVVELNLEGGIAVKGMGLIATRLPNNVKGFSLLIIITAEDFKPIPLPLGFRLTGIGGLLAINRTFDEEALRAGLKNRTLDSVMFPKDPIRNAPQILSNLNRVFPPANGHHLFGPMAQIAWGTPTLITADLGVVLELGARLRLLILAQVVAILPKRENDLVRLQMDAIGVIDFDQGTAALDATLYDSRLLKKFVLTGDMAMRLKWEGSPNFALAIGGLHPAFNPPPNFPKLERIAINLSAGDNPRIRCEAYFALTSNTVQFGARAELYVSVPPFSIQGETGFDVLFQRDPFYFIADFYAQVQLKRKSTNLFKVRVEGALAGPRPLHIKAKATFEILWWDISIRIDTTLVKGEKPPPPEPIDVLPRLKEALGNPGNWIGQLPDGQRPMVTLRARPRAATEVLLHPLGTLTVKQNIVPLNMDISRFGQAAPAGARHFTISIVSLGDQKPTTQPVKDFFAPAQFFEMSDDEKLSRPSFEPMAAGVSIGSNELVFTADANDWLEVQAIEFETITADKKKNESRRSGPKDLYKLSPVLLGKQAIFGATGNSDIRRTGKAKYRTTMVSFKITEQSLTSLKTQGVPDDVLEKLQGIKNQEVRGEERFLALLKTTIGDERTVKFKSLIMKHATTMGKHRIAKEGWSIIATDDLTVKPVPGVEAGKAASYSEAAQALRKMKQQDPVKARGLKILRLRSEVQAID